MIRFLFALVCATMVFLGADVVAAGWQYPTTAACSAHVEFRLKGGKTQSFRIAATSEDPLPAGRPQPQTALEHASSVLVSAALRTRYAIAGELGLSPKDIESFPSFGVDRHVCWNGPMSDSAKQAIASWPAPTWPASKPARIGLTCRGIVYFRKYIETSDGKELGAWEHHVLDGFGLAGPQTAAQSQHEAHLRKLVPTGAFTSGPFALCWDGAKPTTPPMGWNDHANVRW